MFIFFDHCIPPKRRFGKDEQKMKGGCVTPPKRRFWKAEHTFQNTFSKHFSTFCIPSRSITHALEKCFETRFWNVCSAFQNLRLGSIDFRLTFQLFVAQVEYSRPWKVLRKSGLHHLFLLPKSSFGRDIFWCSCMKVYAPLTHVNPDFIICSSFPKSSNRWNEDFRNTVTLTLKSASFEIQISSFVNPSKMFVWEV